MHEVSFIGMGYVGLCTAVCFANRKYKTVISAHDAAKAMSVNKGIPPFYEPRLKEMLQKAVEERCLKAVVDREEAILE